MANSNDWRVCKKSTAYSVHSRRCFVTGEYCSKQTNVYKERDNLHRPEKKSINAFVIMNFSEMSDVVYKWRLQTFIKSLKKYIWINTVTNEIACVGSLPKDKTAKDILNELSENNQGDWVPVEKINVIRSDSNPASNYVICNRICQQMQIADLVIVDVSVENTNVFYEFGMAVAFGKLILPICYSESFYAIDLCKRRGELSNHIGYYPWRKRLFEYYGIRFRQKGSNVKYEAYEKIKDAEAFDDSQYGRFPYTEDNIGEKIYTLLYNSYQNAMYLEGDGIIEERHYNTVVVYTMDGFLNADEAGQCIVNYYNNLTNQLRIERCFCGDRVGILGQSISISDDHKDAKNMQDVPYNVSDIIRIGMNQATFLAQQKKIKTDDYMHLADGIRLNWKESIDWFTQAHIDNRCIPAYPDNPIYVKQYKDGIQRGILEETFLQEKGLDYEHYFCLFHVMLYTLKYTNEIVVDISQNSVQALFWLGVAHGSDVHAITVRYVPTERDLSKAEQGNHHPERNIFDVAGLWTAILQSNDTEGFYQQLALAQIGIEQRSKLMLDSMEFYEDALHKQLYKPSPFMKRSNTDIAQKAQVILDEMTEEPERILKDDVKAVLEAIRMNPRFDEISHILANKNRVESRVLESYYRERFWRHMLRYNELGIYVSQEKIKYEGEPRLMVVKWDVDAMAELSHYLSKRKVIGKYHQEMPEKDHCVKDAERENFIAIGGRTKPLKRTDDNAKRQKIGKGRLLAEHIADRLKKSEVIPEKGYNVLRSLEFIELESHKSCEIKGDKKLEFRGFTSVWNDQRSNVFAQFPHNKCSDCMAMNREGTASANHICTGALTDGTCEIKQNGNTSYYQLAQLLFWREVEGDRESDVKFYVSLVGVSGPATLALTSLLVDDDQKKKLLDVSTSSPNEQPGFPLNSLQTKIRKIFMNRFINTLDENLKISEKQVENWKQNREKTKYAASMYLSTVLYQYFLPLLSIADEDRICNGMHAYVTAPDNAISFLKQRAFQEQVDGQKRDVSFGEVVERSLRTVVTSFRGVEAIYQVKVQINGKDEDTRRVLDIQSWKPDDEDIPAVSCLFM